MPKKNKKTEIFDAAIRCIGKLGIERTNAQAIADELGVAQSGIFYYFPKQETLFDSLTGYIAEVNHLVVTKLLEKRKPKTAYEGLSTHIEGNFLWAKRHPDQVAVLMLSIAKTAHSKFMQDLLKRLFAVGEDRIYAYLTVGVAERQFTVRGDIRDLASFIQKTLIGFIIAQYLSKRDGVGESYFFQLLDEKLRLSLDFSAIKADS